MKESPRNIFRLIVSVARLNWANVTNQILRGLEIKRNVLLVATVIAIADKRNVKRSAGVLLPRSINQFLNVVFGGLHPRAHRLGAVHHETDLDSGSHFTG
jgi:hypothetical protein